jgi:hypothetical protein
MVMVMLSDEVMWPKQLRLANVLLKASGESERDTMLKVDFDAVKDLDFEVQSQSALVIATCDASKRAHGGGDDDEEEKASDGEEDFGAFAAVAKIEQVHARQEIDTQMAHELASDAERVSRFEAPRTHGISHFQSPGLSCFECGPSTRPPTRADLDLASSGGAGSFARKVSHYSLAHPQVRPHLPVYDYESDSGPPPLE